MSQLLPLLFLVFCVPISPVSARARECADIDIRNDVKNLQVLRNCTVVHGYLRIVLIENNYNNFTGVSFPDLREITGFLMLYRVMGLQDLGKLFPNLVVIRGATLFADYALVVYQLPDLGLLGLRNLLAIEKGSVRIEHCNNLCYASAIDWTLIIRTPKANVIPQDATDKCPDAMVRCRSCPMKGRCWSHVNCQKRIGEPLTKSKTGSDLIIFYGVN